MKLLHDTFKATALLALTVLLVYAALLVRDNRQSLKAAVWNLKDLTWNANESAMHASSTFKKIDDATDEEIAKLDSATKETQKTEHAIRNSVDYITKGLVEPEVGLIPVITAMVKSQDAQLTATQEQIRTDLIAFSKVTDAMTKLLGDADTQLKEAQIKELAQRGLDIMDSLDASLKNLEGITGDGKKAADYLLAQLTKPVKLWKSILTQLLHISFEARGVLAK